MKNLTQAELNFNSLTHHIRPQDPEFQSLPCPVKELVMMLGIEPCEALRLAIRIGYWASIPSTAIDPTIQIRPSIPLSERGA